MRGMTAVVAVCAATLALAGCATSSDAVQDGAGTQPTAAAPLAEAPIPTVAGRVAWSAAVHGYPVDGGVVSTAGRWWVVTRISGDPAGATTVLVGDATLGTVRRLSSYPRLLAWPTTVATDGRLVTVVVQGSGTRGPNDPASWSAYLMRGYDALSGRLLWSRDAGAGERTTTPCFLRVDGVTGGTLVSHLACTGDTPLPSRLVAVDLLTGASAWAQPPDLDARLVSVGAAQVAVAFRSDGAAGQPPDAVALLQAGSGRVSAVLPWTVADALVPTDALVPADGGLTVVTVAGQPDEVRVVDAAGRIRWRAEAVGTPLLNTVTGTVVVQRPDGGFDGRDLQTGTTRWRISAAQSSAAQLTLSQARDRFATGNAGDVNVAVDAQTGAVAVSGQFNDVNPAQWNGAVYVDWADGQHVVGVVGPASRSPLGVQRHPVADQVIFPAG